MRITIAGALALFVVGCGQPAPSLQLEAGDVGAYRWRGQVLVPVRAGVINNGDTSVWLRKCTEAVEKQVDGAWVPGHTGLICLLDYDRGQEIKPGAALLVARDLLENLELNEETAFPHGIPGHYRMVLEIGKDVNGNWENIPVEQRTFEFNILGE